MRIEFFDFNKACSVYPVDVRDKATVLAMVIGLALNRTSVATIPTSQCSNPEVYFRTNLSEGIEHLIDCFNEEMVFRYDECLEFAKQMWLVRYESVHPCSHNLPFEDGTFFEAMLGVKRFVAQKYIDLGDKYKKQICMLSNGAVDVILKLQLAQVIGAIN